MTTEIEDLLRQAIDEYIGLCDRLMNYAPMTYEEKSMWVGWRHGMHIRYTNKVTKQVVEVPFEKILKAKDVDIYFLEEFIQGSTQFVELAPLFSNRINSRKAIIAEILSNEYFRDRTIQIPEFNKGDLLQLRDSIFANRFKKDPYWNPSYYYEDPIVHIYYPIGDDFSQYGDHVPTVFGGLKTKIEEIVTDEYGFMSLHTDLFIINMPYAFQRNQFKKVQEDASYKLDHRVEYLIENLSVPEHNFRQGLINSAERENRKREAVQAYHSILIHEKYK